MAPFLSLVVTGRNDDVGGDFTRRFFRALRFNYRQLVNAGVDVEIIFVEWRPLADRPWLATMLAKTFSDLAGHRLSSYVVDARYHTARTVNAQLEQALEACRQAAVRDPESDRKAKLKLKEALQFRFNERAASLQRQLAEALHDRLIADSHMALVETKLDILEGAIQALDTRTREGLIARDQAARSPQGS